jgi:abequosyltransferase
MTSTSTLPQAQPTQSDHRFGRPKLSVCIPTYNRVEYLTKALQSVIEQADPALVEIVVCDNDSTDGTAEVVAQIARDYPNLRYIQRELNVGCDRNVIEIGEYSTGEYFWIFGSDDTLPAGAMDIVLQAIAQTQADLILGDAYDCDINMQQTGQLKFLKGDARKFHFNRNDDVLAFLHATTMTASLFGYISSMIFKRETWDRIPLSRYTLGSAYPQVFRALDIVFRASGEMAYLAKPVANNRRNNCGYTVEFGQIQRYMIDLRMFRIVIDEYFSQDVQIRNLFKKFVRACFGRMAYEKIRTGIPVMDALLEFFEADDAAIPAINHWERDPVVERAYRRFQQNGIAQQCFSGETMLHIGYRHEGSATLKPITEKAIGVEIGYSGYDGASLPFESASMDTIYLSDYFPTKYDIAKAVGEWRRVLHEGGHIVITNTLGHIRGETVSFASILTPIEAALPIGGYQVMHCAQSFPDTVDTSISEGDIVIRVLKHVADTSHGAASKGPSATELLAQAIQAHGTGNVEQATALAQQVLQIEAANVTALQLLGLLAYQRGDHVEAICRLSDAIKIDASLVEAYQNMGCAYAALGGNAEAMQCFEAALALRPNFVGAANNLAILRSTIAQHEAQRQNFLLTLVAHPKLTEAQALLKR